MDTVYPSDKSADEIGWFPCAKKGGVEEKKTFNLPKNFERKEYEVRLSWIKDTYNNFKNSALVYTELDKDNSSSKLYIAVVIGIIGVLLLLYKNMGKKPETSDKPTTKPEEPVVEKRARVERHKEKGKQEDIVEQKDKGEHKDEEKQKDMEELKEDKEMNVDDEPLTEFSRPVRKPQGDGIVNEQSIKVEEAPAGAYKAPEDLTPIDERPVRMGRGRPARPAPLHELMVQAEETIQAPPEILQEKKPNPKPRISPESSAEETKHSTTTGDSTITEMTGGAKKAKDSSGIKKGMKIVVESDQSEETKGFIETKGGKKVWKDTHFIFAFDCSGDMKGIPWDSTLDGYLECVTRLKEMENIIITAFSFDTIRNPFCREKEPSKATQDKAVIPFSGKGRKYERAVKYIAQIIDRHANKDALSCMIFVSNGPGGYTENSLKDLLKQRMAGRKLVSYVISAAPDAESEDDMVRMTTDLGGMLYNVSDPKDIKDTMLSALNL